MRLAIVIGLIVGAMFLIAFFLMGLARDLVGESYQGIPDLENTDEWDAAADESSDAAQSEVSYADRWAGNRHWNSAMRTESLPGSSNPLDDLHSAL